MNRVKAREKGAGEARRRKGVRPVVFEKGRATATEVSCHVGDRGAELVNIRRQPEGRRLGQVGKFGKGARGSCGRNRHGIENDCEDFK
jgi:hypothetical protein